MAQETFYFSHDYNPLDDCKLQALIGTHGAVGYGVFWRVVEKLHSSETNALPLKAYIYIAIGKELSTPSDVVQKIIDDCIILFELFISDGESFWSARVNINIKKRSEIVEKKSKAGKESARIRKLLKEFVDSHPEIDVSPLTHVEHVLTGVEHVSTKEIKGKEIKLN